jgi:ABC-type glycerol-3-phosphate transport system substrate-binding protein
VAFDTAGLPYPSPGWTWEDFLRAASVLTQYRGEGIRYGFADQSPLPNSILAPLVGQYLDEAGGQIEAHALENNLQWYFDLSESQILYPLHSVYDWAQDLETWKAIFSDENTRPAMWIGSLSQPVPGNEFVYSSDNPFTGLFIEVYGFVSFPVASNQKNDKTTAASALCIGISVGTEHPHAAWQWLSFLSNYWGLLKDTSAYQILQVPARQSVAEQTGYWNDLPTSVKPSVRFSLEHAWYGSQFPEAFETVGKALAATLDGKGGFASEIIKAYDDVVVSHMTDPDSIIQVATPLPTYPVDAATINYFSFIRQPQEFKALQSLAAAFQREHPEIVITLAKLDIQLGIVNWFDILSEKFDCFSWYGSDFTKHRPDNLLGLNPLIEAEDPLFVQDFIPALLESYRARGEIIGLPGYIRPTVMAYNVDLLARRGLEPPADDWSFTDFLHLVTTATSTSETDRIYGFLNTQGDELLFAAQGDQWIDLESDPPKVHFDSLEATSTLAWLADLVRSGVILYQNQENWAQIEHAMASGQVAFWTAPAGQSEGWFLSAGESLSFKIGVAPLPTIASLSETYVWDQTLGYFISRQTEHPQACWEWIKFLSEQSDFSQGMPARISVAESSAWEAAVGEQAARVYRLAASRAMVRSQAESLSPLIDPLFNWRAEAATIAVKGGDPKQALFQAQRKADAYLACVDPLDLAQLNNQELQKSILICAKNADPDGTWEP